MHNEQSGCPMLSGMYIACSHFRHQWHLLQPKLPMATSANDRLGPTLGQLRLPGDLLLLLLRLLRLLLLKPAPIDAHLSQWRVKARSMPAQHALLPKDTCQRLRRCANGYANVRLRLCASGYANVRLHLCANGYTNAGANDNPAQPSAQKHKTWDLN